MVQNSLRHLPPASPLFGDYLKDWPRVARFYSQSYSLDSIVRFARSRNAPDAAHRERLSAVLGEQQKSWNNGVAGVDKLAQGAVAVVTGQQPGLFTGPILSVFKAITAIKLARSLEEAGVRAAPVFWVAAEDHDHEEIESTWILNRDSGLERIRVDLSNPEPTPAGWTEFRDDVAGAVRTCFEQLPQSEFARDAQDIVEDAYRCGVSPVNAFARMMARLFAGTELTFVNPLHSELRRLAQPAIDIAIRKNSEMRAAVLAQSRSLSEAGYHEQVKVDEGFTGLFAFRGRARLPVKPNELTADIHWSPNVLLRPVMQDAIFPTAAYIGGPAEVAYFAQAAAVYRTVGIPMPPVFPRISATILEPRIVRMLEKYALDFMDVFRGRDLLKRKVVEAVQDGELFDHVRTRIEGEIESLRPALEIVDTTLLGALDTSRQKILHQVETLRTKYVNAAAKRNEMVERHLESIVNSLYPEKKLQERIINITSFLVRYGTGVVQHLEKNLILDPTEHQLLEI